MTAPPSLVDINGRPIALDRQLASGGEGTVFSLPNNPTLVAKVYHRPPTAQTVEKLTTMVRLANPQLLKLSAWPTSLLFHARTRHLAGFVMPRLSDCQPIQHLYNPVQRLRCYPRAGWNFQVRAAKNLAAAFDEVHKAGGLVGDVNQSNVQVSTQALVRLIDCDSFQIQANGKSYLCEVGVAHYIPPELQGKSLRGLVRTPNHDRFGLAVLIYQLLFVGRHPYAGVYHGAGDPTFEQLIAQFRFAQGPAAHIWGMAPPPYTPTFADVPPELGNLFRRAFERGSETGTRPLPTDWLAALDRLEPSIIECSVDAGHMYWRGARSCVWCRLADHGGPAYYFGVAGGVSAFAVDEAKLQDVLRRLSACGPFDFPYDRRKFTPPRLPEPKPLPDGLFGGWLARLNPLSAWNREYRRRRTDRDHARNALTRIEGEWTQTVLRYRRTHSESSATLQQWTWRCRGLASQYQVELQRLAANAESRARNRHLQLHLVADAYIAQIGATRKQVLASNHIFTAADIEEHRIRGISGFGDVLTSNLLMWKQEVLRQFRFDPSTAVAPAEQRSITLKYRTTQQQMLAELGRQTLKLESLAPACQTELHKLVPALQLAVARYQQAEADLQLLNRK